MMTHVHKDDVYIELLGLRAEGEVRAKKQSRKARLHGLKAKPLGETWEAFEAAEDEPRVIKLHTRMLNKHV